MATAPANLMTTGAMSPDIAAVWMSDELLERAEKNLVFYPLCKKSTLPKGEGRTIDFTRYERLALPAAPLTEGVTPTATPITLSKVQVVLDQWGAVAALTDVTELTIKHPVVQEARDLLSDQYDETVDREVQAPLAGASAVIYAAGSGSRPTARSGIVAANVLSSNDVRLAVSTLRQNGARARDGGLLDAVVDPFVEGDLNADSTFVNAAYQSNVKTLKDFEIGTWLGCRWMRSNAIPILSQMTTANVTGAAAAASAGLTAFTGTVRWKAVRLDPQTRAQTVIQAEQSTAMTAQILSLTIASGAPTGTYLIYATFPGGATGTATLQCRVEFVTGTAGATILLSNAGAPSASNAWIITGSGPVAPADTSSTVNVHTIYITGKNAWGCSEISEESLKTYMTKNESTTHDPLAQQRMTGWKGMFKAAVLNNDFFRRIECASAYN